MKTLVQIPTDKIVEIVEISGGKGSRKILAQLGIGIGSRIILKKNAPFSGPLLVENHGTTIAIGRGLASRIMVEEK
jgi:ferrous iron transport protein A